MRIVPTTLAIVLLTGLVAHAQAPVAQTPSTMPQPGTQPPAGQVPPQTPFPGAPQPPGVVPPPGPTPVTPAVPLMAARAFTSKTGMLFSAVRPERALDFETVIGYLQSALAMSTDPTARAQAEGWKIYKATEPGPNGTLVYVFVLDPVVPGAEYGLGRILADAYPDKIVEIWKLYTTSLAGGGSLLNLNAIIDGKPVVPPVAAPAGVAPAPATPPGTVPPATTPPATTLPSPTPPATTPIR